MNTLKQKTTVQSSTESCPLVSRLNKRPPLLLNARNLDRERDRRDRETGDNAERGGIPARPGQTGPGPKERLNKGTRCTLSKIQLV